MAKRRKCKRNSSDPISTLLTWVAIFLIAIFLIRAYEGAVNHPISTIPEINQLIDDVDPVKHIEWNGR